jgi:hypothetical protein
MSPYKRVRQIVKTVQNQVYFHILSVKSVKSIQQYIAIVFGKDLFWGSHNLRKVPNVIGSRGKNQSKPRQIEEQALPIFAEGNALCSPFCMFHDPLAPLA